jgi:hypothetical protein
MFSIGRKIKKLKLKQALRGQIWKFWILKIKAKI